MLASMLWAAYVAGLSLLVYGAKLALERSHVGRILAKCQRHDCKVSAISYGRRERRIEFESSDDDPRVTGESFRAVNLRAIRKKRRNNKQLDRRFRPRQGE
jgi:hypothetical protein